jgi:hypothetical protein
MADGLFLILLRLLSLIGSVFILVLSVRLLKQPELLRDMRRSNLSSGVT